MGGLNIEGKWEGGKEKPGGVQRAAAGAAGGGGAQSARRTAASDLSEGCEGRRMEEREMPFRETISELLEVRKGMDIYMAVCRSDGSGRVGVGCAPGHSALLTRPNRPCPTDGPRLARLKP